MGAAPPAVFAFELRKSHKHTNPTVVSAMVATRWTAVRLPLLLLLVSSCLVLPVAQAKKRPVQRPRRRRRKRRLHQLPQQYRVTQEGVRYEPQKPNGDDLCPCLTAEALATYRFIWDDLTDEEVNALQQGDNYIELVELGLDGNTLSANNTYGVGCAPHDLETAACADKGDCTTQIPLPDGCEKSWCERSWCFVDTDSCHVENIPTATVAGVSKTYATCGHMDAVTYMDRLTKIRGQTFKVAINHDTGGWLGAYHPTGQSFMTDNKYYGPIVRFMDTAATLGGYTLNVTRPPDWLQHESEKFFGNSLQDYCIYATALGYLDFCIADYTISTERAAVTPFFETRSDEIFLVVFKANDMDRVEMFLTNFITIFKPFTGGVWAFICLIMLPLLGLVMMWHESSFPGSAFPKEYTVQITNTKTGKITQETRKISMPKRLAKALYMSLLSLVSGGYDIFAISVGGKIHLLAILSFLVLILAVYTANLAAILTSDLQHNPINSIDEALVAGYQFCATRRVGLLVAEVFDLKEEGLLIPDPISEGGDGKPGFNCPNCEARTRVFDFMKQDIDPSDRALYCDAALVVQEDIVALQAKANHCNKTIVGERVATSISGIPMHRDISPELIAYFYDLKFGGAMQEIFYEDEPASLCKEENGLQEEGADMNFSQLSGIWVIVFTFMLAGVLAKAIRNCQDDQRKDRANGELVEKAVQFDQWGNAVENPNVEEMEEEEKKNGCETTEEFKQEDNARIWD